MEQILHGSATTTEAFRRTTQSQASLRDLTDRHDISPKTVAKWWPAHLRLRCSNGPKAAPNSTVLTKEEESLIVTFRKHTLLVTKEESDTTIVAAHPSRSHWC